MESREWTAQPNEELKIPAKYLTGLDYEIIVLSSKKLFIFKCADFKLDNQICTFSHVIMDTSKRNARGDLTLQQVSYHEKVILANTGFMAIPVPEGGASETPDD